MQQQINFMKFNLNYFLHLQELYFKLLHLFKLLMLILM